MSMRERVEEASSMASADFNSSDEQEMVVLHTRPQRISADLSDCSHLTTVLQVLRHCEYFQRLVQTRRLYGSHVAVCQRDHCVLCSVLKFATISKERQPTLFDLTVMSVQAKWLALHGKCQSGRHQFDAVYFYKHVLDLLKQDCDLHAFDELFSVHAQSADSSCENPDRKTELHNIIPVTCPQQPRTLQEEVQDKICKLYSEQTRRRETRTGTLPKVLTVCLDLFNEKATAPSRNKSDFPYTLQLKTPSQGRDSPMCYYRLFALISHSGSTIDGGSYTAHVNVRATEGERGQWYCIGESVKGELWRSVSRESTCLLFYEQIACGDGQGELAVADAETAQLSGLAKLNMTTERTHTASGALGRLASLLRLEETSGIDAGCCAASGENDRDCVGVPDDKLSTDIVGEANQQLAALASLVKKNRTQDKPRPSETSDGGTQMQAERKERRLSTAKASHAKTYAKEQYPNSVKSRDVEVKIEAGSWRSSVGDARERKLPVDYLDGSRDVVGEANQQLAALVRMVKRNRVGDFAQLWSEGNCTDSGKTESQSHSDSSSPLVRKSGKDCLEVSSLLDDSFKSAHVCSPENSRAGKSGEYPDKGGDVVGFANQQLAALACLVTQKKGRGHSKRDSEDTSRQQESRTQKPGDGQTSSPVGSSLSTETIKNGFKTRDVKEEPFTNKHEQSPARNTPEPLPETNSTIGQGNTENHTYSNESRDIVGTANQQLAAMVKLVREKRTSESWGQTSKHNSCSGPISGDNSKDSVKADGHISPDFEQKTVSQTRKDALNPALENNIKTSPITPGSSVKETKAKKRVIKQEKCIFTEKCLQETNGNISKGNKVFENARKTGSCKGREISANETLQQFAALAKGAASAKSANGHGEKLLMPSTGRSVISAVDRSAKIRQDVTLGQSSQESTLATLAAVMKMKNAVRMTDAQPTKHDYQSQAGMLTVETDTAKDPQLGSVGENVFSASLQMLQIAKLGSQLQPDSGGTLAGSYTQPSDGSSLPVAEPGSEGLSESFRLTIPDDLQRCIPGIYKDDAPGYERSLTPNHISDVGKECGDYYDFNSYAKEPVRAVGNGALTGEYQPPSSGEGIDDVVNTIKISNVKSLQGNQSDLWSTSEEATISGQNEPTSNCAVATDTGDCCANSEQLRSVKIEPDLESSSASRSSPVGSAGGAVHDHSNVPDQHAECLPSTCPVEEQTCSASNSQDLKINRVTTTCDPIIKSTNVLGNGVLTSESPSPCCRLREVIPFLGIDGYPNSSFLNAVLQAFRHCPSLAEYAILAKSKHENCPLTSLCSFCQLYDVVMADTAKALSKASGALYHNLQDLRDREKSSDAACPCDAYEMIVQSVVREIGCHGICLMRVKEKTFCKSYQHFEESDAELPYISLSVDDSEDLQDALDKFFVDRDVKTMCKQCPRSRAKRFLTITQAPRCLVISVGNKDRSRPNALRIAKNPVYLKREQTVLQYDLTVAIATPQHHHVAFLKRPSDWVRIEETEVREVSPSDFQRTESSAALLFYEKGGEEACQRKRRADCHGDEPKKIKQESQD